MTRAAHVGICLALIATGPIACLAGACANALEPPLTSLPVIPPSAPAKPPPRVWHRLEEVRTWPAVSARSFVSAGHGTGDWKGVVRVSSDLVKEYRRLPVQVSPAPGAVAAEFHTLPDGTPGPTFVMEKLPDGTWEYLALDETGTVLPDSNTGLCQRCHTEAPSGSLFGIPARFRPSDAPAGAGGAGGRPAAEIDGLPQTPETTKPATGGP